MKLLVLKAGILNAAVGGHYIILTLNYAVVKMWYQMAKVSHAVALFLSAGLLTYVVVEILFCEVTVHLAATTQFMKYPLRYVALTS